jgi:mRNA interferase MazF
LIRLSFLAVLPSRDIVGSISLIARERHRRLLQALADYLVSDSLN